MKHAKITGTECKCFVDIIMDLQVFCYEFQVNFDIL